MSQIPAGAVVKAGRVPAFFARAVSPPGARFIRQRKNFDGKSPAFRLTGYRHAERRGGNENGV
ncbi:MAG: hypothetical protein CML55_07395 [Rhodobacteraceae bacterium]|nr:hypothetical protein [Paracoccaceae bacterium]